MLNDPPRRIAVLCSRHAPALGYLLDDSQARGTVYDIACVVTSEPDFAGRAMVEAHGVPFHAHAIRAFYTARGARIPSAPSVREAFDAETLAIVRQYAPDLLLMDGYVYLVTSPLLAAFARRILNLHYSDLAIRTPAGEPRFPGIRAVRDALEAGCAETRVTVHLVTDAPDAGPPLVRSWPFPVSPLVDEVRRFNGEDAFRAYAFAHQHWMMRAASGPLAAAALKLVASGAVDLDELAQVDPRGSLPWLLERHGFLLAPEIGDEGPVGQASRLGQVGTS